MIKAITVTNDQNESLRLVLDNPESSEIVVESVDGLAQEKANINSTDNQVYDGSTYDSSVVPQKPIIINLKFLPNDGNVERIRHKCYDYFPTTKNVNLEIETDERYVNIDGYVESNLPEIFSEQEGAAITVLCMDPYFKGHAESKTMLKGVEEAFQFPFSNESLYNPLIVLGGIYNSNTRNLYYYGEKETGINIKIEFSGDLSESDNKCHLFIRNTIGSLNEYQVIDLDIKAFKTQERITQISDGDYILIDTRTGNKTITFYKGSSTYDMLPYINLTGENALKWILLNKGYNKIEFHSTNDDHIKGFVVNNKILYRGV